MPALAMKIFKKNLFRVRSKDSKCLSLVCSEFESSVTFIKFNVSFNQIGTFFHLKILLYLQLY